MCQSIFIAIPKKPRATECGDHRTISLISHITKIVLRVLLERARNRTRNAIAEEQYGFKRDCGCRNAIFVLRMLGERCIEMQKDLYLCFIDYEKAFDSVEHETLFTVLENSGIDGKDLRLLQDLYWKQEAAIRINGTIGKWIKIRKGARQGCGMSPDFFNLYGEEIIKLIKDLEGVRLGGRNVNNLRFADDATLIADSEEKLQELLNKLAIESERKGLKINIKKTFCMVIAKSKVTPTCRIKLNGNEIKQVMQFKYLGSMITSDGKCEKDITSRIGMAKQHSGNSNRTYK